MRCNMFRDYFINSIEILRIDDKCLPFPHNSIVSKFNKNKRKMRTYYYPAPDATESQEGKGLTTLLTFDLLTF